MKKRRAVALATLLSLAPLPLLAEEPLRSETWLTYCAVCHGEDGKAQTEKGKEKGARDLTNRKWQDAVEDGRLVSSITKGRDKMPSFAKKLTPEEIKALVLEVRAIGGKKPS